MRRGPELWKQIWLTTERRSSSLWCRWLGCVGPTVSPYNTPLVTHKSLRREQKTCTLEDSWICLDHWWGIARVGALAKAATPFHWPANFDWCLLATGWPATTYLKGDWEHRSPCRNRCIAWSLRCVSDTSHKSPWPRFSLTTIALLGSPDGLKDPMQKSRRHRSVAAGPGLAASPTRHDKIKRTLRMSVVLPQHWKLHRHDLSDRACWTGGFQANPINVSPKQRRMGYRDTGNKPTNAIKNVNKLHVGTYRVSTPHHQRSQSSDLRLANKDRIWAICDSNIAAMFCCVASACPWIWLCRAFNCVVCLAALSVTWTSRVCCFCMRPWTWDSSVEMRSGTWSSSILEEPGNLAKTAVSTLASIWRMVSETAGPAPLFQLAQGSGIVVQTSVPFPCCWAFWLGTVALTLEAPHSASVSGEATGKLGKVFASTVLDLCRERTTSPCVIWSIVEGGSATDCTAHKFPFPTIVPTGCRTLASQGSDFNALEMLARSEPKGIGPMVHVCLGPWGRYVQSGRMLSWRLAAWLDSVRNPKRSPTRARPMAVGFSCLWCAISALLIRGSHTIMYFGSTSLASTVRGST